MFFIYIYICAYNCARLYKKIIFNTNARFIKEIKFYVLNGNIQMLYYYLTKLYKRQRKNA